MGHSGRHGTLTRDVDSQRSQPKPLLDGGSRLFGGQLAVVDDVAFETLVGEATPEVFDHVPVSQSGGRTDCRSLVCDWHRRPRKIAYAIRSPRP
jgi:hypothetical protein